MSALRSFILFLLFDRRIPFSPGGRAEALPAVR
jgi:hypothetical protein